MKKAGKTLPKDWERDKEKDFGGSRSKNSARRGSETWQEEESIRSPTYATSPALSAPAAISVSGPSPSSSTSLATRKRWEIRSSEVIRDGEKLGQGGFGAVYKGYVVLLLEGRG